MMMRTRRRIKKNRSRRTSRITSRKLRRLIRKRTMTNLPFGSLYLLYGFLEALALLTIVRGDKGGS